MTLTIMVDAIAKIGMSRRLCVIVAALVGLMFAAVQPCLAGPAMNVNRHRLDIRVIGQSLSGVLADIGRAAGLRIVGGRDFSQSIAQVDYQGSLAHVMNVLGQSYGFIWYRDRDTIFIDRRDRLRTVAIRSTTATPQNVAQQIASLGFDPQRWPLRALPSGGIVVSGPRRYVEMVRSIVATMSVKSARITSGPLVVRGPSAAIVR